MKDEEVALIDGDIIVYSCACAGETRGYAVGPERFRFKKEVKAWCKQNGVSEDLIKPIILESPKLEDVYKNIDTMLFNISQCLNFPKYYCIYLTSTDKSNFRYQIAVTHPYKGNRQDYLKPLWYDEAREYLIKTWKAFIINGGEADDAIAYYAKRCDIYSIICSIDKDLDQIVGWHFNWNTGNIYYIDERTAKFNLYCQILTGDRTDNILGIPKIGPVKAKKLLKDCQTEMDLQNVVAKEYIREYSPDIVKAAERYVENKNLLELGERYIPLFEFEMFPFFPEPEYEDDNFNVKEIFNA